MLNLLYDASSFPPVISAWIPSPHFARTFTIPKEKRFFFLFYFCVCVTTEKVKVNEFHKNNLKRTSQSDVMSKSSNDRFIFFFLLHLIYYVQNGIMEKFSVYFIQHVQLVIAMGVYTAIAFTEILPWKILKKKKIFNAI